MKYIIISVLFFTTACSGSNTPPELEGSYTNSFEHEFGRNEDTLIVKKINDKNIYQIFRHTGLVKKLDSKEFPKEVRIETWTLEYNTEKQILTELKQGKILIWEEKNHLLRMGNRAYKKL